MRRFLFILLLVSFSLTVKNLASEEKYNNIQNGNSSGSDEHITGSDSINIDMKVVYGQYHNMLSTINLSQEQKDFVYLLSSYFKRSNDFGYNSTKYENSSFYENRIGFTGNLNITDSWKSILEAEVYNDSRGMFDNALYSREESERVNFSLKNISKLTTSFEGFLTIGGAGYVHRLRAAEPEDQVQSRLNQMNVKSGGEYIWSASNRVRFNAGFYQYDYLIEGIENDRYLDSEIIDDFNITRNIGVSFGANFDWNKDDEPLVSPIVGLSLKGHKQASLLLLYRYDLIPFIPEDFYLRQKYIKPTLDIPPAKVHHGEVKAEVRLNSIINIKGTFIAEKNNNFYNYSTVTGNVLSAETIPIKSYITRGDAKFSFFKKVLILTFTYKYSYYESEKNITYRPDAVVSNSIKYNGKKWKVEWNNEFFSEVYIDPDYDRKLAEGVIGYFGMQRKMLDSFYAYIRLENLYNCKYNLRDGYPEPGFSLLGGLRILI